MTHPKARDSSEADRKMSESAMTQFLEIFTPSPKTVGIILPLINL